MREAYEAFLAEFPDYASTTPLDALRASDYGRLDAAGHVYLDYTGACLYGASQITEHSQLLNGSVLGNPHSASPSSSAATSLVERARSAVLAFFNAAGDYTAIFTLNASGALKHVGECYPFAPGSRLLLTADNHNSVNGIREFAQAKGASVDYVPLSVPELRVDAAGLEARLSAAEPGRPHLFAYPAQSNFSGVQHPLGAIEQAHAKGWDVLLDAAAFVSSNRLDLNAVQPDFVGLLLQDVRYPTGVGCLLVAQRRDWKTSPALVRRWHRQLRDGARTDPPAVAGGGGLRGRHVEFSGHPRGGTRPSAPGRRRSRARRVAGSLPHGLAARAAH